MIETVYVPRFDVQDAISYIYNAFVLPRDCTAQGYISASGKYIIVEILHEGTLYSTFICN